MSASDNVHNLSPFLKESSDLQIKVFKRRWIILFLYILYAGINAYQWFEYSIIANIIMKYYEISSIQVDWTSIIYVIMYMPMVIPASYLIEKKDLRFIALVGCFGTALGTIVKSFSFKRNSIWLIYLGQTLLSSMQVFILALPPKIAIVWFGAKQVSLACCLGVFGTQLGQAVGLLLPPMIVKNHDDVDDIAQELSLMTYVLAGLILAVSVCIILYFPSQPPLPPNLIQAKERTLKNKRQATNFTSSLKSLLKDQAFVLHAHAYGISVGVFIALSTLLNEFILTTFKNSEEDAGRIGLLAMVTGMTGAIIIGVILDKTHRFKETTVALYSFSALSMMLFTYALHIKSMIFAYVGGILLGFFINSYTPVGLELAIELTYPDSESTSSGILISMSQTGGTILTLLAGYMLRSFGLFFALGMMILFLVTGSVMTAVLPNRLRRYRASLSLQDETKI